MKKILAIALFAASFASGYYFHQKQEPYHTFKKENTAYIQNNATNETQTIQGMQIGNAEYALAQIKRNLPETISLQIYQQANSLEQLARSNLIKGKNIAEGFLDPSKISFSLREAANGVGLYLVKDSVECALQAVKDSPQLGSLEYRMDGIKQEIIENANRKLSSMMKELKEAARYGTLQALDAWKELKKIIE